MEYTDVPNQSLPCQHNILQHQTPLSIPLLCNNVTLTVQPIHIILKCRLQTEVPKGGHVAIGGETSTASKFFNSLARKYNMKFIQWFVAQHTFLLNPQRKGDLLPSPAQLSLNSAMYDIPSCSNTYSCYPTQTDCPPIVGTTKTFTCQSPGVPTH